MLLSSVYRFCKITRTRACAFIYAPSKNVASRLHPRRSVVLTALRLENNVTGQPRAPKIYTRTGDKGTSSLFTGERRPKDDLVFETMGDVDEVSSNLGLSKNTMMESWQNENFKEIAQQFEKIQCTLQDVNSCIATPQDSSSEARLERTKFDTSLTEELEEWIDLYTAELPPLKNFILPSGGVAASHIHITRSVCRRAERKVVVLVSKGSVPGDIAKYMNRLSDFFFTIARYVAMMEGHVEKIYKKPRRKKAKTDDADDSDLKEA